MNKGRRNELAGLCVSAAARFSVGRKRHDLSGPWWAAYFDGTIQSDVWQDIMRLIFPLRCMRCYSCGLLVLASFY